MTTQHVATEKQDDLDAFAGRRRSAVLYAAPEGQLAIQSLLRAQALAQARGQRLIVLRVIPTLGSGDPLFPHLNPERGAYLLRLERATRRLTERLCARHLVTPLRPEDIRIKRGRFDEVIQALCAHEEVSLIVVPRMEGFDGAQAAALAIETQTPVMVASLQGVSDLVIAGSDLEDRGYPVLRFARDFCARLRAPSLFVHSVSPVLMAGAFPGAPTPLTVVRSDDVMADRERRLKLAAQRLDTGSGTELQSDLDPANALVELARKRGADVVVVGARPRPWWRTLGGSIAARVVDHARASVLVLPLASPPAWLPRAWS